MGVQKEIENGMIHLFSKLTSGKPELRIPLGMPGQDKQEGRASTSNPIQTAKNSPRRLTLSKGVKKRFPRFAALRTGENIIPMSGQKWLHPLEAIVKNPIWQKQTMRIGKRVVNYGAGNKRKGKVRLDWLRDIGKEELFKRFHSYIFHTNKRRAPTLKKTTSSSSTGRQTRRRQRLVSEGDRPKKKRRGVADEQQNE